MTSRANIDAAAGGAFLDLTIAKAKELVEKMVSNQGWSDERLQPRTKGMHTIKETDMIVAKLLLTVLKCQIRPSTLANNSDKTNTKLEIGV